MDADKFLERYGTGQKKFYGIDSQFANLSRANLRGANLKGANLSEADLIEASLERQERGARDRTAN